MHSNSLSERDKKHDHQQQILQSIVYLSIVRREPSGKSNMFDFPDDRGSTPMAADSAVFICHKLSGTIPDRRESASAMIADELRYMKTRLKSPCIVPDCINDHIRQLDPFRIDHKGKFDPISRALG